MNKWIYLAGAALALGLTACNEPVDGPTTGMGSLKLKKLDIEGSKYLYMVQANGAPKQATGLRSNTKTGEVGQAGLFKVDAEGNVSTAVLTCVETSDSVNYTTRTDLTLLPLQMVSFDNTYTLFTNCELMDSEGNTEGNLNYYSGPYSSYIAQSYSQDEYELNILMRNADGSLFFLPRETREKYFWIEGLGIKPDGSLDWESMPTTVDEKGNFYIACQGNVGCITLEEENLVVKQLNPSNVYLPGNKIDVLPNGTVLLTGYSEYAFTALYPNGGFEQGGKFPVEEFSTEKFYISALPDGLKAVKLNTQWGENTGNGHERDYTVSVCDFTIGTSYGDWSMSAPLASLSSGMFSEYSDPNVPWWASALMYNTDHLSSIHETANGYLVGNMFLWEAASNTLQALTEAQSEAVILPTKLNTYQNKSWYVWPDESSFYVQWFDTESLEGGEATYDVAAQVGAFLKTSSCVNIPGGEATMSGVRYADGKQVLLTLDIATGEITCTETDDAREITTLIPMN